MQNKSPGHRINYLHTQVTFIHTRHTSSIMLRILYFLHVFQRLDESNTSLTSVKCVQSNKIYVGA